MSQISSVIIGGPPFVGPVLTLTGDNAVAVTPVAGTIFISGAPSDLITTSGDNISHTITVELKNQLTGTVQTVNNTPTLVPGLTIPMTNDSVVYIYGSVIAATSDFAKLRTGDATVSARKQGVNPAVLNNPVVNYTSLQVLGGFFPVLSFAIIGGNTVGVVVTGEAATIINWRVNLNFFFL